MYNRTQNENGSYNTRCLDCFITIAFSVETEKELDQREMRHICPEKALAACWCGNNPSHPGHWRTRAALFYV